MSILLWESFKGENFHKSVEKWNFAETFLWLVHSYRLLSTEPSNRHITAEFAKVFFLKSFPLYGSTICTCTCSRRLEKLDKLVILALLVVVQLLSWREEEQPCMHKNVYYFVKESPLSLSLPLSLLITTKCHNMLCHTSAVSSPT